MRDREHRKKTNWRGHRGAHDWRGYRKRKLTGEGIGERKRREGDSVLAIK
jgi:hypothetical protein